MLRPSLELGQSSYNIDRVPIYSASSYASLMSQTAAFYIDPLRDIYEVNDAHPLVLATLKLRIHRPLQYTPSSNSSSTSSAESAR